MIRLAAFEGGRGDRAICKVIRGGDKAKKGIFEKHIQCCFPILLSLDP